MAKRTVIKTDGNIQAPDFLDVTVEFGLDGDINLYQDSDHILMSPEQAAAVVRAIEEGD